MALQPNASVPRTGLTHDSYEIAWVCTLHVDVAAAIQMLDEKHELEALPQPPEDTNIYLLGSIGGHNIVIAKCLLEFSIGLAPAIDRMRMMFQNIKHALLVGIGGGVPVSTQQGAIRLGHVVVSQPTESHYGAIQFSLQRKSSYENLRLEPVGFLEPAISLLTAAREVTIQRQRTSYDPIWRSVEQITQRIPDFGFPGAANDHLYSPKCFHVETCLTSGSCMGCDPSQRIERPPQEDSSVVVHRGTIASLDVVVRDAEFRDAMGKKYGILCFDTRAAGVPMDFPCIIIRGIADYCDTHKNDQWNEYASLTAVAYARQLLLHLPVKDDIKSSVEHNTRPDVTTVFAPGSNLSSQPSASQREFAIGLLAKLLVNDKGLKPLYANTLVDVDPDRFQRNLGQELQRFARNLRDEGTSEAQHETAEFIRQHAQNIAAQIRMMLVRRIGVRTRQERTSENVNTRMELQNRSSIDLNVDQLAALDAEDSLTDSSADHLAESQDNLPGTSEDVKAFMITADTILKLLQDHQDLQALQEWREVEQENFPILKDGIAQGDLQKTSVEGDSSNFDYMQDSQSAHSHPFSEFNPASESANDTIAAETTARWNKSMEQPSHIVSGAKDHSWSTSLWLLLRNACFPSLPGYHRIHYECGCGQMSYVDVKELSDGGIERFRQRLLRSIAAVKTHPSSTPASTLQPPPQAHLSPTSGSNTPSSVPSKAGHGQHSGPSQSTQPGHAQVSGTGPQDPHSRFLLLCISTNNSTTLVHLEIGSLTNDQYLFQKVDEEYRRVRDEHTFGLSRVIPLQVRRFFTGLSTRFHSLTSMPNHLNFGFLSRIAMPELAIFKVSSGDFVRFSLVPVGLNSCPRWFKTGELPPEIEVHEGRYIYEPVPMTDVEIDIPLDHLLRPGSHTDNFWITTFPKKVKDPLIRVAGSKGQVVGWGIRVNESLNWLVILPSILFILMFIGASVVVYAVTTSDNSSAFGLGAFLLALFTVYITYQYFAWRDQID